MKNTYLAAKSLPTIKGFANPTNPAQNLAKIISGVVAFITIFASLAFLFYFIIAAISWITSGGKPDQLTKAKSQMGSALTGLFIAILIIPITYLIGRLTGLDIIKIDSIINSLKP